MTHRSIHSGLAFVLALAAAGTAQGTIINGSFEADPVTHPKQWDIFTSLTGWQLASGQQIEVQAGVNGWLAADGTHYIELDSDFDGPGGSVHGEAASSSIYQDVSTSAGYLYTISFAMSPRPGVKDNALEFWWDGALIDTISANGAGLSNTAWTYYTYTLEATSPLTTVAFSDASKPDSLGTFLDDVNMGVMEVPEPAALLLLAGGVVPLLITRR